VQFSLVHFSFASASLQLADATASSSGKQHYGMQRYGVPHACYFSDCNVFTFIKDLGN
jgi:hypothetical protein